MEHVTASSLGQASGFSGGPGCHTQNDHASNIVTLRDQLIEAFVDFHS